MAEFNSRGFEVWLSSHVNGKIRPELETLPLDEYVKTLVDHAPDLSPELRARLAMLFQSARVNSRPLPPE